MPTHSFVLNGEPVSVDVSGNVGLLYVLRDILGVTGPKYGCGVGVCRACTSHLNGQDFQPCITPVSEVQGQDVTTIEGLADGDALHPLQQAWIDLDVAQCGYCQPGQIMAAAALVARTGGHPTDADIDSMENICRCGTYFRIRQAIKQAAAAAAAATPAAAARPTQAPPESPPPTGTADTEPASTGDVLAGAALGPTRGTLPATGGGAGAAALIAAAAAAVTRGRSTEPDTCRQAGEDARA